jgi:hypothetical protein
MKVFNKQLKRTIYLVLTILLLFSLVSCFNVSPYVILQGNSHWADKDNILAFDVIGDSAPKGYGTILIDIIEYKISFTLDNYFINITLLEHTPGKYLNSNGAIIYLEKIRKNFIGYEKNKAKTKFKLTLDPNFFRYYDLVLYKTKLENSQIDTKDLTHYILKNNNITVFTISPRISPCENKYTKDYTNFLSYSFYGRILGSRTQFTNVALVRSKILFHKFFLNNEILELILYGK